MGVRWKLIEKQSFNLLTIISFTCSQVRQHKCGLIHILLTTTRLLEFFFFIFNSLVSFLNIFFKHHNKNNICISLTCKIPPRKTIHSSGERRFRHQTAGKAKHFSHVAYLSTYKYEAHDQPLFYTFKTTTSTSTTMKNAQCDEA